MDKTSTTREIVILVLVLVVVSAVAGIFKFWPGGDEPELESIAYQNPYAATYDIKEVFKRIPSEMPKSLVMGRALVLSDPKREKVGEKTQISVSFTAQNTIVELASEYQRMLSILGWTISVQDIRAERATIIAQRSTVTVTINIKLISGNMLDVNVVYLR